MFVDLSKMFARWLCEQKFLISQNRVTVANVCLINGIKSYPKHQSPRLNYEEKNTTHCHAPDSWAGFFRSAQTVVAEWGASGGDTNIVSTNKSMTLGTSFTTTVNPTVGADYYNTPGANSTPVFGGVNGAFNTRTVQNNGGGDRIVFGLTTTALYSGMILWDVSNVELDTLSIETLAFGAATAEWRYVIQKGASSYVSDATSMAGFFAANGSPVSASTLTWYDFTVQDGVNNTGNVGLLAAIDMTGVTRVGYYVELLDASGGFQSSQTQYFQATAIPEPGTYALIAGMLALTAVMVRRR